MASLDPLMVSFEVAGKDPEIDIIDVCVQALAQVDSQSRERVVHYLVDRYGSLEWGWVGRE